MFYDCKKMKKLMKIDLFMIAKLKKIEFIKVKEKFK